MEQILAIVVFGVLILAALFGYRSTERAAAERQRRTAAGPSGGVADPETDAPRL